MLKVFEFEVSYRRTEEKSTIRLQSTDLCKQQVEYLYYFDIWSKLL